MEILIENILKELSEKRNEFDKIDKNLNNVKSKINSINSKYENQLNKLSNKELRNIIIIFIWIKILLFISKKLNEEINTHKEEEERLELNLKLNLENQENFIKKTAIFKEKLELSENKSKSLMKKIDNYGSNNTKREEAFSSYEKNAEKIFRL